MEANGGALFEEHLDWAERLARAGRRKLPPSFDVADLQQEARLELWRQVQRFDASLGVPFRGFAYFAVRGAVLMACRRKQYREATHEELKATSHHVDKHLRPDELLIAREEWRNRLGPKLYRKRRKVLAALQRIPAEAAHLVRMVYLEGSDMDELERLAPGSKLRLARALQTLRRAVLGPPRVQKRARGSAQLVA